MKGSKRGQVKGEWNWTQIYQTEKRERQRETESSEGMRRLPHSNLKESWGGLEYRGKQDGDKQIII